MVVKQVRLTKASKDKMSRLKGKTGVKSWNVLARWALCCSIREGSIPAAVEVDYEDGVEMSWHTFSGEYGDVYELLVREWCDRNGLGSGKETVAKYFALHLERGVGYLSGTNLVRSIDDLLAQAFAKEER